MKHQVDAALMEMQSALLARSLYPVGSSKIDDAEARAHAKWSEVLNERYEATVFAVDGRVIFNNEILDSSALLMDTLFHALQDRGIDQLTLTHGLTQHEIHTLLDRLAAVEGRRDVDASEHLRLGSLDAVDRVPMDIVPRRKTEAERYASEAADVLPGIWQGLSNENRLNRDEVGDIVSCLCRAVANNASALIPLAPLKRHDEYTFVHTINVAILSISLGEAIGMSESAVYDLSIAALLHDVGKQAVPRELLNKSGLFTQEERDLMEIHPVAGARMLLNTPGVPELATIVAYEHHIRADGGGYPRVPPGWQLNLASRVVQLVDVFDALRTNRPYRAGLPLPRIIDMMKSEVGTFFDADLVKVFFEQVVSRGLPSQGVGAIATR